MTTTSHFSLVLETPAAKPEEAYHHFLTKLSVETDAADVRLDLQRGQQSFLLVDARSAQDFEECHIPGAINLPYRKITAASTAHLSKEKPLIVYCWSPGCNAATKAAVRLSALGFQVKEMIGGLEYWRREGGEVEGTLGEQAPLVN
ncbi:rhodanese-related sulfurtransferase [Thermosporothrix hazakensis]|jgi:rhodanese-related sulfurtransferase|uniref:Rhodanese-related sulfurtransferase n=1 Tax=Thermosporothrix hazakensis TaxID=644383 RepID=A0A326TPA0_THEHA|nr:rhodanese-like domain-containing protein [Thermosporothrix hazakensis]PZW18323.1 rhodanese-related sulfurtransferase [Thermosporothrix hazakensis]GCE51451.1 rhodanese [Thermosporothrix hazakensis]